MWRLSHESAQTSVYSVLMQKNPRSRWVSLWITTGVLVFSPGVVGADSMQQPKQQTVKIQDEEQLSRGEHLYDKHCALCHGESGEGYIADNANALGNQDFLVSVSDEFLWHSIANGRPGTPMAAHHKKYDGPLTASDISSVVAYIRNWQKEATVDVSAVSDLGDVASGQNIFIEHCAVCHGNSGEGVSAVSLNNPEFLSVASDGQIRWAISKGRRGTPMVAFEQQLPAGAIDDLVSLIRSWEQDAPVRLVRPYMPDINDVVLNPSGDSPEFSLRNGRYVSAEQLYAALESNSRLVLLDARPASDWHLGHIPGAISAPHYKPEAIIDRLPRDDTWIVSYCACPHKYSDELTDALINSGLQNTVVLDEGVKWWQDHGYPIE